jgi:hypothetical protein
MYIKYNENCYLALRLLIDQSYVAQKTQLVLPPPETTDYYKEFCTVKMATSRGSGHTRAIAHLAYDYFKSVIILSPNQNMSLYTKNMLISAIGENNIQYYTSNTISTTNGGRYYFRTLSDCVASVRGIQCEAVFIDCASTLQQERIDNIYRCMAPCMHYSWYKLFIFVE